MNGRMKKIVQVCKVNARAYQARSEKIRLCSGLETRSRESDRTKRTPGPLALDGGNGGKSNRTKETQPRGREPNPKTRQLLFRGGGGGEKGKSACLGKRDCQTLLTH